MPAKRYSGALSIPRFSAESTEAPTFQRDAFAQQVQPWPEGYSKTYAFVSCGNTVLHSGQGTTVYTSTYAVDDTKLLADEVAALRLEIRRLAEAVDALANVNRIEEVASRELSAREARDEIVVYLRDHGQAYPSDIADALNLDYELVAETLDRLHDEGAAAPRSVGGTE